MFDHDLSNTDFENHEPETQEILDLLRQERLDREAFDEECLETWWRESPPALGPLTEETQRAINLLHEERLAQEAFEESSLAKLWRGSLRRQAQRRTMRRDGFAAALSTVRASRGTIRARRGRAPRSSARRRSASRGSPDPEPEHHRGCHEVAP